MEIIKRAKEDMREMLESVYSFNSSFPLTEKEKKLLSRIIEVMIIVDRKFFVENPKFAYEDYALPVGYGQTISQPSTVARMLVLADLEKGQEVLEIGAGSGWNACLISFLVKPGNVVTIDRISSLVEKAKRNIKKFEQFLNKKIDNLFVATENALDEKSTIWKKNFDRIIITAGIPHDTIKKQIEKMAKKLLREKGLLICPYTEGPMLIYRKNKKVSLHQTKEEYLFVPLLEGTE